MRETRKVTIYLSLFLNICGHTTSLLRRVIKAWKHELKHNKFLFFIIQQPVPLSFSFSDVHCSSPPFIDPSLCMFLMTLLVKITNKTKWPQLCHVCTNQAIEITRKTESILFLKIGLYILLHFTKEMLSLLNFFPYNYYIIQDCWYFKSCFSMILLISLEFYFIYIFSICFLKIPKRKHCLLFGTRSSISTEKIKANDTGNPSHVTQ